MPQRVPHATRPLTVRGGFPSRDHHVRLTTPSQYDWSPFTSTTTSDATDENQETRIGGPPAAHATEPYSCGGEGLGFLVKPGQRFEANRRLWACNGLGGNDS